MWDEKKMSKIQQQPNKEPRRGQKRPEEARGGRAVFIPDCVTVAVLGGTLRLFYSLGNCLIRKAVSIIFFFFFLLYSIRSH